MEGTGSYGARLARSCAEAGVEVVEVDRPNRQERRRKGKSDTVDAIEAARAAQGQRQLGAAKTRDGNVEAIRALMVAKRSAQVIEDRCAEPDPPSRVHCPRGDPPVAARRFSPPDRPSRRPPCDPGPAATRSPTRPRPPSHPRPARPRSRRRDATALDRLLDQLLAETAPACWRSTGSAIDSAAALLVAAGDNPERLRSEAAWARLCGVAPIEASSGKVTRHRLNPGGNRQANAALWHIVITRMSSDPRTAPTWNGAPRRAVQERDHPGPQALRRPRGLPLHHRRRLNQRTSGGGPDPRIG